MKLYIMKKDMLMELKQRLPNIYMLYYTEKDGSWVEKQFQENPYNFFMEIPEFQLANLYSGMEKGKIDLKNCKVIYKNLSFLSPSQASDERFWAALTHKTFYNYMRERWGYAIGTTIPSQKDGVSEIKNRFFFTNNGKSGYFRNTFAKCWWIGKLLYDPNKNNFEMLDTIGTNNFNSKVTEIFYNYTFSSHPTILNGIVECFEYFNSRNKKINVRNQLRPTLQKLNAIGGGMILDCLSSEEIRDIMIDNITSIMEDRHDTLISGDDVSEDENEYEEDSEEGTKLENTELENNTYRINIGDVVTIISKDRKDSQVVYMRYHKGKLSILGELILNKTKNDTVDFKGKTYDIATIEKSKCAATTVGI